MRLLEQKTVRGYLNPNKLGRSEEIDLLTPGGEHQTIPLAEVRSIYFVREFTDNFEPERKAFFSRPKLEGIWVRLRFRDNETIEGIVPNDLLELLDRGVQITPPDLHGECSRIYIPRSALAEMTVLGVVGVARRAPQKAAAVAGPSQPKLFEE